MEAVLKDGDNFFLRFQKGEEVFSALKEFLKKEKVSAASFSAIGASAEVELGYYSLETKTYKKYIFFDEMEIIAINGNVSLKEGEPFVHAHGIFGKNDFSTVGGHVFKLKVSVTCEMSLTRFSGDLVRKYDKETDLCLL